MQNPLFKLTALAGIAGIGFLVVLQTQRGLSTSDKSPGTNELLSEFVPSGQAGESPIASAQSVTTERSNSNELSDSAAHELPPLQEEPAVDGGEPNLFPRRSAILQVANEESKERAREFSEFTTRHLPKSTAEPARLSEKITGIDFRAAADSLNDPSNVPTEASEALADTETGGQGPEFTINPSGKPATAKESTSNPFANEVLEENSEPAAEPTKPLPDVAQQPADAEPFRLILVEPEQPVSGSEAAAPPAQLKVENAAPLETVTEPSQETSSILRVEATETSEQETNTNSAANSEPFNPFAVDKGPIEVEGPVVIESPVVESIPAQSPEPAAEPESNPFFLGEPTQPAKPVQANEPESTPSPFPGEASAVPLEDNEKPGIVRISPAPEDSFDLGGSEPQAEPLPAAKPLDPTPEPFSLDSPKPVPAPAKDDPFGLTEPAQAKPAESFPSTPENAEPEVIRSEVAEPIPFGSTNPAVSVETPTASPVATMPSPQQAKIENAVVVKKPHLRIEKQAPPRAVLGMPMVYSIIVRNSGETIARDVTVEDRVPEGTTLTGTNPQATLDDKKLSWKLGDLEAGAEKKIAVRVIPRQVGEIGSVATVNFQADLAAKTNIAAPKLQLELLADEDVSVGENVVLHFRLSNAGSGDAKNVLIRELVPEQLVHPAGNDIEYAVGTVPAGESRDVELTLTAVRPGTAVNRAVVTAAGTETVEHEAPLKITGTDLSITRTGPEKAYVGRTAEFTNQIVNSSQSTATNLMVLETVPSGMEFVDASAGGKYDMTKQQIVWYMASLPAGQRFEYKLKLRPKRTGTLTSTVQLVQDSKELMSVSSKLTSIGFASLGVTLDELDAVAAVGEKFSLRVRLRNRGTASAKEVSTKIVIPAGLQFVSARGPVQHVVEENEVQFTTIPFLGAGREAIIDLELSPIQAGESRVEIVINATDLSRPITREEVIVAFDAE